jgi:hypothetical protein
VPSAVLPPQRTCALLESLASNQLATTRFAQRHLVRLTPNPVRPRRGNDGGGSAPVDGADLAEPLAWRARGAEGAADDGLPHALGTSARVANLRAQGGSLCGLVSHGLAVARAASRRAPAAPAAASRVRRLALRLAVLLLAESAPLLETHELACQTIVTLARDADGADGAGGGDALFAHDASLAALAVAELLGRYPERARRAGCASVYAVALRAAPRSAALDAALRAALRALAAHAAARPPSAARAADALDALGALGTWAPYLAEAAAELGRAVAASVAAAADDDAGGAGAGGADAAAR